MASVLVEKIEQEFLCCICCEELQDPIGLPCLHGFCLQCLDNWYKHSEDETYVICPTCKKQAPIPEEGIEGFPKHFLIKNLKQTIKMEKMVGDPQDMSCSICGKKANLHCVDCNKSLCQQCLTCHNTFTKDHKVVTDEELQSGQVTDEGRFCKIHGEQVRYFCETEMILTCMDCISLKTCPVEHERVILKEAAEKHTSLLDGLIKKCIDNKVMLQEAVKKNQMVLNDLDKSAKQSQTDLVKRKHQYLQQVEQAFVKQNNKIDKIQKHRVQEIEVKQKAILSQIDEIEEVCNQVSMLNQSSSELFIIHKYISLSKTMYTLSTTQPEVADEALSYLEFKSVAKTGFMDLPFGHLFRSERWKLNDEFRTHGLGNPIAVAINDDGDVAVSSFKGGVRVYSMRERRQFKCSLIMDDQSLITDIAVSHDNRYIISNEVKLKGIQSYDNEGQHIFTIPVSDINNEPSNLSSVAIDTNGQILAGLVQNTISIHSADGSHISKFATRSQPFCLSVTSNNEIVCSFFKKNTVELLNYSGACIRVINPPAHIKQWTPRYVCCGQGDIFVVNGSTGVYRFTADGDYLGCVTTDVSNPTGIALSEDGMELYVAECTNNLIKIF